MLKYLPESVNERNGQQLQVSLISILARFLYDDLDEGVFSEDERTSIMDSLVGLIPGCRCEAVTGKLGSCIEIMIAKEKKLDFKAKIIDMAEASLANVQGDDPGRMRVVLELMKGLINTVDSAQHLY